MGDTQSDSSGVCRVIQNADTFTTRDERISPSERFSKPSELNGVIEAAPKNAGWPSSHVTGPNNIRTHLSTETAAIHQPANSEPSCWPINPPSVKKPPARRVNPSHSGGGTAGRKHGKTLLRLGMSKGCRPQLISTEVQTHQLVWAHDGSHHLNSTVHCEIETNATVGSSQIKGGDKSVYQS